MVMVVLMGAILVAGLRTTFRWQNAFWIIASAGTFLAFIVLVFGSHTDFVNNFNSVSATYGSPSAATLISNAGSPPDQGRTQAT